MSETADPNVGRCAFGGARPCGGYRDSTVHKYVNPYERPTMLKHMFMPRPCDEPERVTITQERLAEALAGIEDHAFFDTRDDLELRKG